MHVVSQRARVLRLRRANQPLAYHAASRVAFPPGEEVGDPDQYLFEAQSPGPLMPLSTLRLKPRGVNRKPQGQDGVAFSFPVGLFHPLQHAGLARRTPGRYSNLRPIS